jgi:hypothetical protein
MDYDLRLNDDGTYSTFPFYQPVDIRFVTPLLRLSHDPYLLWLRRIEAYDEDLENTFQWIGRVNARLYDAFERAPQDAV